MIEAVNSTIANAALVRNTTEQVSAARLQSPPPAQERREVSVPLAPFVSPFIKVDTQFDTAVLQIRDSDTGDVIDQFPRETTLAARQRQEALREIEQNRVEQQAQVDASQSRAAQQAAQAAALVAQQQANANAAPSAADAQLASVAFAAGAASTGGAPTNVSVTA